MSGAQSTEYVRLNKTPFSERWEVVRLADDGRTIAQRWPLHPDDVAMVEAAPLSVEYAASLRSSPLYEPAPERCGSCTGNGWVGSRHGTPGAG